MAENNILSISSTRKVPIHRNSLFYSPESISYEKFIGKNYIEQDMNQTVVLYQIDGDKTNINTTYGETREGGVRYKVPVEIHCVYQIEEPELKAYDTQKNVGTYVKIGKLKMGVYQETLNELNVDINKGDYIGVQVSETRMIFFSVVDPRKNKFR